MVRLVATLAVIGWFVVLTRAEPSVLRAGTMAALAALAFAVGSEREPPRLLACAVVILLAVDPLLVRSVGFWLSVGATAGVTILGPPLRRRLARLGPLATPVAMSIGAQLGVLLPSVLVFGRVRGDRRRRQPRRRAGRRGGDAVRAPGEHRRRRGSGAARRVDAPVGLGTRWVDVVAAVAAAIERRPPWNVVVSIVVLGTGLVVCRRSGRDDHLRQSAE